MTALTTSMLEAGAKSPSRLEGPAPGAGPRSGQTQAIPCSRAEASGHRSAPWTVLLGSDSWSEGVSSSWIWQQALPALCQVPEAPSVGGWAVAQ